METTRKLKRSAQGRMIGGVAAGLAEYLKINRVLVRLAFLLLTFVGGLGLVAYAICWILMPRSNDIIIIFSDDGDERPERPGSIIGGIAKAFMALMVVGLLIGTISAATSSAWFVAFAVGLIIGGYFLLRGTGFGGLLGDGFGLHRSTNNRLVAGVFGGLAERYGLDATLLRVAAVVLTFAGVGSLIPLYLLYVILVPKGIESVRPVRRVIIL